MDVAFPVQMEKKVRGLPHIKHGGELCDSCLARKQRRLPFPKAAKYHAKEALELVHACYMRWSAVLPPTRGRLQSLHVAATPDEQGRSGGGDQEVQDARGGRERQEAPRTED